MRNLVVCVAEAAHQDVEEVSRRLHPYADCRVFKKVNYQTVLTLYRNPDCTTDL